MPRKTTTRKTAAAAPRKTTRRAQTKSRANSAAGRPRKYSPKVRRTILDALKTGNYRSIAFRLAGIHEDTGFDWLKQGRADPEAHPEYAQLELDMLQAEAQFENEMLKVVARSARNRKPQSWLPAMTVLERTRPERFARRDTTVIEGGESPLQVLTHGVITDPELRSDSLALLRRAAAARPDVAGGTRVGDEPPNSED